MTAKKNGSLRRRIVRTFLVTIAVFGLAVLGLHIWFVNNARHILKDLVTEKSHGKLKMELSQLSFDFFSNKLQIRTAELTSTDSVNQAIGYHVTFRKLTLRIHSFWPLVFQNKLVLDSIKLHDPDIEVIQWHRDTTLRSPGNDLTVPQQMGQLYKSMLDGLDAFGIRRIIINNARLSLLNRMDSSVKPVVVSRIYFDLWRNPDLDIERDKYVKDEQNIELRTTNQSIMLPSGRHILTFRSFHLGLFQKRVELDSCIVEALPTETSKSSYKIFFDKLLLIGVDFDAMYRHNLIRADSVYCERPYFDITLHEPEGAETKGKKLKKPDLDRMVRELTGDLDLAFVGVKEAGFHIRMTGNKERSLFNSSKDNFEMRGLRINADSSKPVVVKQFDMLVRDYQLYNEDSSTSYSFDSIRFRNNKVILSNFTVLTQPSATKNRPVRDFRIPRFELTGLDWFELIFSENIVAQEAALYNPVIQYKKFSRTELRKRTNIFNALQTLDSLMTLNKIRIINGQLNIQLGKRSSFVFEDLNLSLYSNEFMRSRNREGLRKAVEFLSFTNGVLKLRDLTARFHNMKFSGNNLLHCDKLTVNSTSNRVNATANDVFVDNMVVDDEARTIIFDGLHWRSAAVALHLKGEKKNSRGLSHIRMRRISGGPTRLRLVSGATTVSADLNSIQLASLDKNGREPVILNGLSVLGHRLELDAGTMQVRASGFHLADGPSRLEQLNVQQTKQGDTMLLRTPLLSFVPDINGIISGSLHMKEANLSDPVIRYFKHSVPADTIAGGNKKAVMIDELTLDQPDIAVRLFRNDSLTAVQLPAPRGSRIKISGLVLDQATTAKQISVSTDALTVVRPGGDTLGVSKGRMDLKLADVFIGKKDGRPHWFGTIEKLQLESPEQLKLGKSAGLLNLEKLSLGNLKLASENMGNLNAIIHANVSAWLQTATGSYVDSNTSLQWYNARYNYKDRSFRLDSFAYHPTQPRDSVVAHSPYQTDYITLKTGEVLMRDFDLQQFKKDSALVLNTMEVTNPYVTVFRDKLPPFHTGRLRPLPVVSIKGIEIPVDIKRIDINEGNIAYTEKNAKTRAEGTLGITHLNGFIGNIKNGGFNQQDSLRLSASALLMDSAFIHLDVRESYTDSLAGFLMDLRMRPTSLSFLNPVLAPMSNVIITSGVIDSFQLHAVGRDDISYGKMTMYYHDLKIKLVKGAEDNRSTFITKVLSSLVNTFIVKKHNRKGRTGLVYFERLRDRSFFNYIVKMTFSGLATSIGVKKNGKYERMYRKKIRETNAPEIKLE